MLVLALNTKETVGRRLPLPIAAIYAVGWVGVSILYVLTAVRHLSAIPLPELLRQLRNIQYGQLARGHAPTNTTTHFYASAAMRRLLPPV